MKGNYFYAVANGRQIGVFLSWDECRKQVNGFPKAKFKKFDSINAAESYINDNNKNTGNNKNLKINNIRGLTRGRVEKSGIISSERGPSSFLSKLHNRSPAISLAGLDTSMNSVQEATTDDLKILEIKCMEYMNDDPPIDIFRSIGLANSSINDGVHYIYCDGASKNNGKPGAIAGYGVFFGDGDSRNVARPLLGKVQTNQRAELSAILLALKVIYEELSSCEILDEPPTYYHIKTDSKYSINCILNWSKKWIKNSWKSSKGEAVCNLDLIKEILLVLNYVNQIYDEFGLDELKLSYVPGHSGDYGNDQADALANTGVRLH